MRVLVTDGETRSALAVTRSLGRKGCDVFVAGELTGNISSYSKFCKGGFQTPSAMTNGKKYCERISEIVSEEKIDIIFPITEQSILHLNGIRDEFSREVILACPSQGDMDAVSNKYRLFQLAEELDVPIPETTYVNGIEDFLLKKPELFSFPVVIKPAYSKINSGDHVIAASVMYANDRDELINLYETKSALRYPSLIQQFIVGEGTGLFTLFDADRHLVLFSHRRLLEKPPSGGVSVVSESVSLDPEMVKAAEKLLSAVKWRGVAMVEFKRDVRDGRAKLMEINGRFWGSLQLAVSSGVDFPALCLEYYINKSPACVIADYGVGYRLKWFFGILDHLIIRIKNGNHVKIPIEVPTCWQVVGELLKIKETNTSYDVFDSRDMKPFMLEVAGYISDLLRMQRGRTKA